MNVKRKLQLFNNVLNDNPRQVRHNEDSYCLQLVSNLLQNRPYIPFTSMSLRPYVLAFLLNEIIINNRRQIIEFGAGISTIMMARLAAMYKFSTPVVSVEENKEWAGLVSSIIDAEGLSGYVHLVHAPVEQRMLVGKVNHWYVSGILSDAIKDYRQFDLVMIDGPTAFNEQIAHSRYFALPFLQSHLTGDHAVLLDDANRDGEKNIIRMWEQEFGMKFRTYAETLAVHYKGGHFESNPMKFVNVQ